MRRVEAANPSLTVGAPNLVPEFFATFDTNLMMPILDGWSELLYATGMSGACGHGVFM